MNVTTKFHDSSTYYDYTRSLGGHGVQTNLSNLTDEQITDFRKHVERTDGYFEADLKLPTEERELSAFERDVRRSIQAGATVARACLSGQRRYEIWRSQVDFDRFHQLASKRLQWIEPILKRHRFIVAVENHKDLTSVELVQLLKSIDSEWLGVNVDTGNNIALMEDPYETIETLAPFVKSIHFKDMAVQSHARGFLLSEVPCGAGCLDLKRMAQTLIRANRNVHFNLEMATRDPLVVPCNEESYWTTYPERKETHLPFMMQWIFANPIKASPPTIQNKSLDQQLIDEEKNNSVSLTWMNEQFRTLSKS